MKLTNLLSLIVLLCSFNANAFGPDEVRLRNIDQTTLMISEPSLIATVNYPGASISGVCGLEIIADSYWRGVPMDKLLDQLNVTKIFSEQATDVQVVSSTVIRIGLIIGTYVDSVSISTKDGRPLDQVIRETLGHQQTLILRPHSCGPEETSIF